MNKPVRPWSALAVFIDVAALAVATSFPGGCGAQPEPTKAPSAAGADVLECAAPIGRIRKESCGDIAEEFGALSVAGALKHAGTGKDAEARIDAIRAAGGLANALKEARVELCEEYDRCHVAPKAHDERDATLAELMTSLIKLWNGRRFADPGEADRFDVEVHALRTRLDKTLGLAPAPRLGAPPPAPAPLATTGDALVRIESPGVVFKADLGAVTVSASDEASRAVLRAPSASLPLAIGKRYVIEIEGTYAASTPELIAAGVEVRVRFKYRAKKPAELWVALRSLEEPDLADATTSIHLAANDKGSREVTLAPPPGSSGFYVGLGARGGAVEIDDVELVRGGETLVAARAESASEPHVKTTCAIGAPGIAGKGSFRCEAGDADAITIGAPSAHMFLALRGQTGDHARVRTTSLEGGRSLDVSLDEPSEVIVGLVGPGTATIRRISAREVTR